MKSSMKKLLALFVCVCLLMSGTAYAQEDGTEKNDGNGSTGSVVINETNFPDKNFREYVKEYDGDNDGKLSGFEMEAVSEMFVAEKNISDLTGIEHFFGLMYLDCSGNQLTALNLDKNKSLLTLNCENNQLETLNVSKNEILFYLNCDGNQLTDLDVSKNVKLTELQCMRNQLRTLDVSKNVELTELYCYENQLKELNITQNKELTRLNCYDNQLASLNVSKNVNLKWLDCFNNQLTSLGISGAVDLTELDCSNNQLASLDVSKNVNLTSLVCSGNQLTSLDVRNCTKLAYLDVRPLAKADVQYTKEPAEFYCSDSIYPDDPAPGIDVNTDTNPAEVNPGTSRVDSGAIRKAFGIGENDNIKVNVEQKTAAFADQKRIKDHVKKFGDKVLNIYEVVMSLYKDGQYNADITDNFGRLTLSFYAGREYAGKTAAVYQLHENADGTSEMITYKDLAIDGNGMVTITVSKLSTFAVTLQNSNGGVANANAPATGDSANMTVWVALMMLTMTIIPIVAIIGRRQKR